MSSPRTRNVVPGEALAERLARGPIPSDEALEIAKKIAEAFEEAHEQGIVHRGSEAFWAVAVGPGETFEAGIPERLFEDRYSNKAFSHTGYDVASDGRFLVMGRDSQEAEPMVVIQNWLTELERLVPTP